MPKNNSEQSYQTNWISNLKFIVVLFTAILAYIVLYLHPKELKKLNSPSKTECGYFMGSFVRPDSSDGRNRNIKYMTIKFSRGELNFITSANMSKSSTAEHKQTIKTLRNIGEGDSVCVTYSLTYTEDFGSKVSVKNIPYLIKLTEGM